MASINSKFRLSDYMSPALKKINANLKNCIGSFQSMQAASGKSVNTAELERSARILQKMENNFSACESAIRSADTEQQRFNKSMESGGSAASELISKLKGVAATLASIQTLKKAVELSDEMTSTSARLNLMVDEGSSVSALKSKIFSSAQAARGDYMNTMDSVSQLGILAGSAFKNNDEIVKFTELMNKNFTIAGASAQSRSSAMLQLTQAMASGRLQGDEYVSIIENAPLLAKSIESYMRAGGVTGTMKEWASEGMLTADVIKNALFASADDVEQRFDKMPKTWSNVLTSAKNIAIEELQPVLDKINEIANSEKMEQIMAKLPELFSNLANIACAALDLITNATAWLVDNLSWIAPVVMTALAAFLAFKTVMTIINSVSVAIAFLTSPIGLVILAIALVVIAIYQIVDAVNEATGSAISATGIIFGVVAALEAGIWNTTVGLINGIIQFLWYYTEPLISIVEWVLNVCNGGFNSFGDAVMSLIGNIISWFLSLGKVVTKIIDAIFGTDWTAGLTSLQDKVLAWGKNDKAITISREAPTIQSLTGGAVNRVSYGAAWNAGYSAGENLENMFVLKPTGAGRRTDTNLGYLNYGELSGIADDTKKIADNTSRSEEDLKLLREIAEREAINRFTTAEVKVDMTGMTNTISNTTDIDGFINVFTDRFEKALLAAAEGVHV